MNKNLKISSKLILAFLSVALIPLMISSILYYKHAKKALTHEIHNHLFSVANIQKHRLKSSYEQNIERISLIASRTQMRLSLARYLKNPTLVDHQKIEKIIGDARHSIKGILNISVSSVSGLILASTDKTRIGNSIHEQSYFKTGLKSNRADDLSINQSGQLQITISGPLILDNQLIGVIVVESTAESLLAMTSDYSGLGKTGETMLAKPVANGNMLYLTPLRFDQSAAVNRVLSKKDVNTYLNSGKNDQISKFALDYRNKAVLSVSEQLFIPDWFLIVKIDQQEALEPVNPRKIS